MDNKALFPNPSASTADSLSEQLADITSKVLRFTSAGGAAIALVSGDVAVTRASSGSLAPDVDSRLRLDGSFAGLAIQKGELLYCEDAEIDPRVDSAASSSLGIRSMVMVPVGEKGNIRGVLAAFAAQPNGFRPTHIAVMRTLADIVNELAMREEHSRPAPVLEMPAQRPPERPAPIVAPPAQFTPPEPMPLQVAPLPPEVEKQIESTLNVEPAYPVELPKSIPVPIVAPEPVAPVQSAEPKVAPEPPPLVKDRFEVPPPPPAPAVIVEPVKVAKDPLPSIISLVNQQKKAEKAISDKPDILPAAADPKAITPAPVAAPAPPAQSTGSGAAAKKAPVTNQKPLHVDPVVMPVTRASSQPETMMFRSLEQPASESNFNMKMIIGALVAVLVVAGLGYGVRTFMKNRAETPAPAPAATQQTTAPITDASTAPTSATTSAVPASTTPAQSQASKPADAQITNHAASTTPKPEPTQPAQERTQRAVIVAGNGSVTKRAEAVEAPQVALNGKADMGALLNSSKSVTPTLSVKRSILSPPEVIHRVPPKFPDFARRTNASGDRVVLNVAVGADGKVKQVHLVRGQMMFADAAISAVKQWQYRPAFLNGEAVESTVEVVISFNGK